MSDPEHRSLTRAAAVLLALSLVRWGVEHRGAGVALREAEPDVLAGHIAATDSAADDRAVRERPLGDGERLDPNEATEAELDRLPGVGPATAAAMVAAREGGPGFAAPEDLLAVRGIGPATLERIRPHLRFPGAIAGPRDPIPRAPSQAIDVNRAGEQQLQSLPGIGPALARRIVETRRSTPFGSVDDLLRVRGIGPATVERLRALVTTGSRR